MPAGPSPFLWPVPSGVVSSDFGPRGQSHHDGIDISTAVGTPIRAARAGRVLYSDSLRGYGNLIIVEHDLHFIRDICDHLTVLDQGRVLDQGDVETIQRSPKVQQVFTTRV